MNVIRDAHRSWCAAQSIDADSPVGRDVASLMLEAYKAGKTTQEELMEACDAYAEQRQAAVRLGSPAIDSQN
jgi:hypothetical protein